MSVHTCGGASAGGMEKLRRAECSREQVAAPHPAEGIETERGHWCFCDFGENHGKQSKTYSSRVKG